MANTNNPCQAFIIPACSADAPHRRDRCAIIAWNNDSVTGNRNWEVSEVQKRQSTKPFGVCENVADCDGIGLEASRSEQPPAGLTRSSADVPNTDRQWKQQQTGEQPKVRVWPRDRGKDVADTMCADGEGHRTPENEAGWAEPTICGWWPAEPDVGRVAYGVPQRVDRLKCLGNAVVPAQFYPIFKAIHDLIDAGGMSG